jgi:hypothetical protein
MRIGEARNPMPSCRLRRRQGHGAVDTSAIMATIPIAYTSTDGAMTWIAARLGASFRGAGNA